MISLCLDVVPERRGTLGSYVKFADGPVAHSNYHDTLGVLVYRNGSLNHTGDILAIELVPGMEENQKQNEASIITLLSRESQLNLRDAVWVLEAAFRGRKTDVSTG